MFKSYFLAFVTLCLGFSLVTSAQVTTATYTAGHASSDFFTGTVPITQNSSCPVILNVPVPAGRYVTSINVEYNYEALGFGWQREQSSYLECVTTNTKEATVAVGPNLTMAGVVTYNRTGLTIANGVVPVGGLQFKLHAFRSFSGGGCNATVQRIVNNTYKITVNHVAAPTCLPPTALSLNSVTATTANVGWTTGGATNWEIEYGPAGFTPGTGARVSATTNPFTITGLSPSTRYDFVVRDSCGVGNVSFWSNASSFRTSCSVISAPWVENFDGSDWIPGTGFGVRGSIDTCFSRNFQNNFIMKAGPPSFSAFNSGPSGDHTSGTGKYIYSERLFFGTFPATAFINSPPIDLGPLTSPELTFWYHMFGGDINRLRARVSNDGGVTFTTVFVKTGQQQFSKTDPWIEAVVNLSSYANDTIVLQFQVLQNTTGTAGDVSIDDVNIHEAPTCKKPTNLTFVSSNSNSITIGWTTGGATNWQIEYGPTGFTKGTGTIVNAGSNPFTISGLSANSSYDFYVRDSCSATDKSVWSSVVLGKTTCAPAIAPYFENFDGSVWNRGPNLASPGTINTCWNREEMFFAFKSGPPQFVSTQTGASVDHTLGTTAGKYLQAERLTFSIQPDTATITSIPIDLSPLTIPEMSFWYHMFGADIDKLIVSVSNNHGATYNQVLVLTGQHQASNTAAWKESVINLSAYANDTVIIRFQATHINFANTADLGIDDLSIHEQPSCPKPQTLVLVGQTNSTATLQWTTGGATNWNVEYGPVGFTPGTGTRVNAASNPFTVTGLSANTTYQFYVRDSCGIGDVSDWIGPVQTTTDCNPIAAPYTENFDGTVWTIGTFTVPGNLDPCWDRDATLNYMLTPMSTITAFSTGPSSDHTTGSGKFLAAQRFFGTLAQSRIAVVESPLIDLSPLTTPELTFWYHMFGVDIDSLQVEIFNGNIWKREASVVGQQQTSKTAAWKELLVDISSYANDTIKVRFTAYRSTVFAFNSALAIDDLDIHEQPTCPQPSNLSVTSTNATSATLSWTSGGATNWQIEYGPSGFPAGTGTIVNASTNPFTVTGLNSSSTYDFFVRDSCGLADVSFWVGRATGTTSCLPLLAPFTETFDGPTWVVGTNFNDTGSIAQCWVRTPLANYLWKPGPPIFTSNFTGPSGDHTTGSGKYLFAESIFGGGTAPFDAFVETPLIDLSALTVPELSFWYHMFGTNIGSMAVEIDNGGGYTQIWSKTGQQQNARTAAWKEAVISLAAYANDTIKLRFKGTKASFGTLADAAIDDIDIHEAPTCPKPQNLAIVGKTNSTVTLSWTTGGATNWNIEYGSPGFAIGTGTVVNASTNPYTVTGLSANTGYEFYVRDSCGLADVSDWIGSVGDTTDCNPIAAPYTENFDSNVWTIGTFTVPGNLDACWERDETVNYVWAPQSTITTTTTGPSGDHTTGSGKFIHTQRTFGTVTQSMEGMVMSPLIDLSPLTTPELSFWYHMFGADIDSLSVQVFNGSSWKHELSIVGQQQTSKTALWKEAIIDISSYANDTIKVRFKGYRNSTFAFNSVIAIDDLDIHEQPACPKPSALSITNTSATSVTLSWTTGGSTNWQIQYGNAGFTLGTGTIVNATTNPFNVTGLNSSTTYDFYVRDSCGVGSVSDWYGVATGSTDCLPVLAPFTENFDGSTWTAGPNFNDTGTVAQCWTRTPLANYLWKTGPPAFISTLTGPAADHTTGSGKFIFAESIFGGGTAPFDAFMESPQIDLSALTNPELRFWYHMFGTGIGSMSVEIDNGSGYAQVWTRTGQQQTSGLSPWKEAIVSLSSYVNDTIKIRIKATKASFNTLADAAIDDISVKEAPSCPRPLNITSTAATTTSVTLSWTTGGATNWLIGYRVSGGSGPLTIVPANTNPFTITGLSPSSSYDFYVKDSCALGDVSVWEGPFGGNTQCGVAIAPWAESFNGASWVSGTGFQNLGNQINGCWIRPNATNPNFGTMVGPTQTFGSGPAKDASGSGGYIYTEANNALGTGVITTPEIYIPTTMQNPRFKFAFHMFGSNITSLSLRINTGSGFGPDVWIRNGQQQSSNIAAWQYDSISLNAYKGDTIRLKFFGTNNGFNGDIAIDNVSIYGDPGTTLCGDPTNLVIGSTTPTGFTVNWIGNGNSQVEVVLSGQPQGSGTTYYNVNSPLVVTGLTSNTAYDVYVRDSCGTALFSQWINGSKTTLVCPPITPAFTNIKSWLGVSFNSGATVNADSLHWNFGDGNSTSGSNPSHNYAGAGIYTVTMNAFSDCGSTAQFVDTIQVCDTLKADFTFTANGDTVSFDASTSTNATSYVWDLNGFAMMGQMVNYKFPSPGTKPVTLTVYNACGDSVKITKNVKVCLPPKASWTYNIISTTSAGMKTQFDASASQNAVSYEWDFGDGSPLVTGQIMPQHTYITPGLFYKVTLKVSNTCGDVNIQSFKLNQIGVDELTIGSSLEIYPNPASNFLTVNWNENDLNVDEITIVDATGRLIKLLSEIDNAESESRIDISSFSVGIYIIQIHSNGRVFKYRLIKE